MYVLWSKALQGTKEQKPGKSNSRYINVISDTGGMSVKVSWPVGGWIGYDSCCILSKGTFQLNITECRRILITLQMKKDQQHLQKNLYKSFIFNKGSLSLKNSHSPEGEIDKLLKKLHCFVKRSRPHQVFISGNQFYLIQLMLDLKDNWQKCDPTLNVN